MKRISFSAGNSVTVSLNTSSVYLLITGHPLREKASGMYLISYYDNNYHVITPILSSECITISLADRILTIECADMAFGVLYKVMY